MLSFENSYLLYALLLIPVGVAAYLWLHYRERRQAASYGDLALLRGLAPQRSYRMKHLKFSLCCLIFACMVFALTNPQMGEGVEKGKRRGVDLMFCVDVSNSMLAQDYAPDRLTAVKQGLLSMMDKLRGDRVGLVVFAGKSFVQLPITSDYAAAKMFLSNISTRSVSEQGTDLAGAIDMAAASMLPDPDATHSDNRQVAKVVVVISDGEDHAEDAVEMAKTAASKGILVYTLGIGSKTGEPIPENRNGVISYKKDMEGNTVITRLNEPLLMEVASAGHGHYIHAANAFSGFDQLYAELEKIEKSDIEDVVFSRYNTVFYIPLALALVLLCVELLLMRKKMVRWSEVKWLNKRFSLLALLLLCGFSPLRAQSSAELKSLRQGNRHFTEATRMEREAEKNAYARGDLKQREADEKRQAAQRKYAEATVDYLKADESGNGYYKSVFNLGDAMYKQGQYDSAASKFEKVSRMPDLDDKTRAKAYHNLGNSLMNRQRYQEAVDAYKQALKANPKDMDTKYNLEYAKRKLALQQQQQQSGQGQQDQQQNGQGQQDQQQNGQGQQDQQQNGQGQQDQQQNSQGQQDQRQNGNQQQQNGQGQQDQRQNDQKQERNRQQAAAQRNREDNRQLEALQQNERRTQEKVKNAEVSQGRPVHQEKDW